MRQVIGNNLRSNGEVDPIQPGHRVTAIFGFCDIRQFTDTTEVLQQEVMEFVNSIAAIVHLEVRALRLAVSLLLQSTLPGCTAQRFTWQPTRSLAMQCR